MPYREYALPRDLPSAMRAAVACTWTHEPAERTVQLIVPDGCVDLIRLDGRLVVAGPDTGPRQVVLPAGSRSVGVRLRPGAAGSFLGRPANEVRDLTVDAADLHPEWARLDDVGLLAAAAHATVDPLVDRASRLLGRPGARIAAVADELGVGERTLHRRCEAAVGYGPKTLARIARLHRVRGTAGTLGDRAYAAGYASQSHLADEVRRLTGLTAVRFLEDRADPAA